MIASTLFVKKKPRLREAKEIIEASPIGGPKATSTAMAHGQSRVRVRWYLATIADLMPQTAMVEGQVMLVDPSGKKVVAVITRPALFDTNATTVARKPVGAALFLVLLTL
jgi:hypothetical protein